ncbi:MAG TPA: serine/threonine-protein kinase, partial [Myxococcaceae bacterium]|nr:serine/threonine-protein kinase [Myxococcaceae bacterium]
VLKAPGVVGGRALPEELDGLVARLRLGAGVGNYRQSKRDKGSMGGRTHSPVQYPDPMRPARMGRYEVVGELATGGMAEILLGLMRGPGGFERPVVIKRILPHLARQEAFVKMFLDEARVVAGIGHPNVIQVQELARECEDLFIVMEYLEGETVASLCRRLYSRNESLPAPLAAQLVADACSGLHAAHELADPGGVKQHLVHRDVSPQNLFVTYEGVVKVLDFGIAKTMDRTARTEQGQLKGKLEYMSPEQCTGLALDRRSDIFALGVVLYELLTARRLFKRDTPMLTMKAICEEPLIPPSRLQPDVPAALDGICERALSKSPPDRFQTAMDFRRRLTEVAGQDQGPEQLGRMMSGLFADRMAQKGEMLRRFRSGATVSQVPAGEADAGVDIPTVAVQTTAVVRPPRRRWVAGLALAALAAGLAAVGLRTLRTTEPTAPPLPEPPAAASAAPAAVPPAPTGAEPAPMVRVKLDSQPRGATVWMDGREAGTTPLELTLPRTARETAVQLRRAGFRDLSYTLRLDRDQTLVLALTRQAAARRRDAPAATPSPFVKWH